MPTKYGFRTTKDDDDQRKIQQLRIDKKLARNELTITNRFQRILPKLDTKIRDISSDFIRACGCSLPEILVNEHYKMLGDKIQEISDSFYNHHVWRDSDIVFKVYLLKGILREPFEVEKCTQHWAIFTQERFSQIEEEFKEGKYLWELEYEFAKSTRFGWADPDFEIILKYSEGLARFVLQLSLTHSSTFVQFKKENLLSTSERAVIDKRIYDLQRALASKTRLSVELRKPYEREFFTSHKGTSGMLIR